MARTTKRTSKERSPAKKDKAKKDKKDAAPATEAANVSTEPERPRRKTKSRKRNASQSSGKSTTASRRKSAVKRKRSSTRKVPGKRGATPKQETAPEAALVASAETDAIVAPDATAEHDALEAADISAARATLAEQGSSTAHDVSADEDTPARSNASDEQDMASGPTVCAHEPTSCEERGGPHTDPADPEKHGAGPSVLEGTSAAYAVETSRLRGLPLASTGRDAFGNRIGTFHRGSPAEGPTESARRSSRPAALGANIAGRDASGNRVGSSDVSFSGAGARSASRSPRDKTPSQNRGPAANGAPRPRQRRWPGMLAVGAMGLLIGVVLVLGRGRFAELAGPAESNAPLATTDRPSSVEPGYEDQEVNRTEVVTNESGQILRISGPDSMAVLNSYCATSSGFELFELRRWAPEEHVGVFRNLEGKESLQSIRIVRDSETGRWFAGDGRHPLTSITSSEPWQARANDSPLGGDPDSSR